MAAYESPRLYYRVRNIVCPTGGLDGLFSRALRIQRTKQIENYERHFVGARYSHTGEEDHLTEFVVGCGDGEIGNAGDGSAVDRFGGVAVVPALGWEGGSSYGDYYGGGIC